MRDPGPVQIPDMRDVDRFPRMPASLDSWSFSPTTTRFEEAWWEADDPATDPAIREWVVTLYHPDTSEVAQQSTYADYYEAIREAEKHMPWWDVDVEPVLEPES